MVLPNFKENLEKYAKLLVANGINVQPGHTVALSIDVEQAELAHLLVKEAYALGAAEVIVQWSDDIINRERFCMLIWTASKRFLLIKKLRWNICWLRRQVA